MVLMNEKKKKPSTSFYDLSAILNNGAIFKFSSLSGKKVLIVNTASDCGYTGQYAELEKLYQKYSATLTILAFPSNDFKEQEKGTDEDIASFCKTHYDLSFPLFKKVHVIKGSDQNQVFKWLSESAHNGWGNKQPVWNFCKYLVDEKGNLVGYFGPSVSPLDKRLVGLIQ
jgi:glutathione peroxidase